MTRTQFIVEQADIAIDEANALGTRKVVADDHSAISYYIGEAFDLMCETGYDPLLHARASSQRAARAYALYRYGAGMREDWAQRKQAWRRRAAVEKRLNLFPRRDGTPDEFGQVGHGHGFTIHPFYDAWRRHRGGSAATTTGGSAPGAGSPPVTAPILPPLTVEGLTDAEINNLLAIITGGSGGGGVSVPGGDGTDQTLTDLELQALLDLINAP